MPKVRATIVIDGEVQGVGFRYFVARAGRRFHLTGHVKNLDDGRVQVVCEGGESKVEEFISQIQLREPPIHVEAAEVAYGDFVGEFKSFEIITEESANEMVEGFSTGMAYLQVIQEKQEKTIKTIGQFRDDSNVNFNSLDTKYHTVSEDLRSINQNITKLVENISESNELLAKLVEDYVKTKKK